MKVSLIRPNYNSHLITPQLGIGYISSFIKQLGHEVCIIDGLNLGLTSDEIVQRCSNADIIGINCLTAYFMEVVELSKKLKNMGKKVVIGGPHATTLPAVTLSETRADYVIVGEGEVTFAELLERLEKKQPVEGLPGLMTPDTKNFQQRPFISDLNNIPFPDWEQMNPCSYKKAPHGAIIKNFPVAPIISSRGCPYTCTFCASPQIWNRKIRFRSPENVVKEIQYLNDRFGVREIHFEDDNLTLKKEHIEKICNLIIGRQLKISWAAPNGIRADTLTPELLELMKESGCYLLAFGIESGNQEILDRIEKKTTLEVMEYSVTEAHKKGITTQGFFIFGLPGETKQTIRNTIDFAKRIPLDRAQFLLLDVLPGSRLWDELKNKFTYNWSTKSYQEVTWIPDSIDKDTLMNAPGQAFREFFFRPHKMIKLLMYIRPSQLPFVFKRIMDFDIIPLRKYIKALGLGN